MYWPTLIYFENLMYFRSKCLLEVSLGSTSLPSLLGRFSVVVDIWFSFVYKFVMFINIYIHFLQKKIALIYVKIDLSISNLPKLFLQHLGTFQRVKQLYNQYQKISMSALSITSLAFWLINLGLLELSNQFQSRYGDS